MSTLKKGFLLVSMLIATIFLNAQHHPFPVDSTSVWSVVETEDAGNYCIGINAYLSYLKGDTIINNKTYKKHYTFGVKYQVAKDFYPHCNENKIHYTNKYKGALRSDSGIVYYVIKGSNSEFVLYNFHLNVGDTIVGDLLVTEVDTVNINGRLHKRILFPDSNHLYQQAWIIDGIGSSFGLTGLWYAIIHFDHETKSLLCYAENDSILISNTNGSCELNVGFESENTLLKEENINIYPNPAKDFVIIDFNNVKYRKIELYDLSGKLILNRESNNQQYYNLSLNYLKSGFYLLKITDNNGFTQSHKIFKIN